MASLASHRTSSSVTWSLQFLTRSRTISFSFSATERARRHHRRLYPPQSSSNAQYRPFSSRSFYQQQAAQPAKSPPPPPTTGASASTKTSNPKTQTTSAVPPDTPTATTRPASTTRNESANSQREPIRDISATGLSDLPAAVPDSSVGEQQVDWTRSFHGMSAQAFSPDVQAILMQPIDVNDIEVRPEGVVYLPEIKYRRILNRAFGPGGWGLAPRGETIVTAKSVTREYALVVNGRLVSIARGEQDYFDAEGIPTATEGCKSNALMRCCKDLGIASELWDPRFVRRHLAQHARETWVEHVVTKKRRKITIRKDDEVMPPFKEIKVSGASGSFS